MTIRTAKSLIADANGVVENLSASEALVRAGDPSVTFIDVREADERAKTGSIPGAVHAPRGILEFVADPTSERHDRKLAADGQIVLFCASGGRSALAAKTLKDMGYDKVAHITGGFPAWKAAGGPSETA